MLTGKNYAGVTLYVGVTSLAAKQVCLRLVKRATCTDFLAKSRTTLYFPQPTTFWFVARQIWFVSGKTNNFAIECFHMTSRLLYWIFQNNETAAMWCSKPILSELNSFLMQTIFFNLRRCWLRDWKRSIQLVLQQNKSPLPVVPYLNVIRNQEPEKFLLVALESEIQHYESWILLNIEIRNSSSTDKSHMELYRTFEQPVRPFK